MRCGRTVVVEKTYGAPCVADMAWRGEGVGGPTDENLTEVWGRGNETRRELMVVGRGWRTVRFASTASTASGASPPCPCRRTCPTPRPQARL